MRPNPLQQVTPIVDELGGPLGIIGRVAGFGPDEVEAGIPWWGLVGVGVVGGAVACYFLKDRIEAFVNR